MRVLLVASPSPTRLHNMVPLAWALRTAGHDVKVAGRPTFVAEILHTGCVAVELEGGSGGGGTVLAESPVLVEFTKLWRPAIVVSDAQAPAGVAAAHAVGAQAVRLLGPLDDEQGPTEADRTLDTVPLSLRSCAVADTWMMRHVPYFGPVQVPAWLHRKPRRQRIFALSGVARLSSVFAEMSEIDAELVCAGVDSIPSDMPIPANVKLVDDAPPAALVPTCAAVVHDGDAELALAAAAHGVPQLSLAESELATRVAAAGAGLAGPSERSSELLADDGLRAGAGALRDEIAALPSPRTVAAELTARTIVGPGTPQ